MNRSPFGVALIATLVIVGCGPGSPSPPRASPDATAQAASPEVAAPAPTPAPSHATLPSAAAATGSIYPLDTALEDQNAEPFALSSLRGHPVVISMFYSRCSYACPTLIDDVRKIEQALDPAVRARLRVLLVSFDVEHDAPGVLAALADKHGVDTARWTFARAADDEGTRELAGALGIKYRRLDGGDYNHSSVITLLDPAGVPLARIDGLRQDATAFLGVLASVAP